MALRRARRGFRLRVPMQLLIAPQSIVPGDPVTARDIAAGQVVLAGRTVQARGQSIFAVQPPNQAWLRTFFGFSWLADFRDVEEPALRAHARALVAEWMENRDLSSHPSARLTEVAAERLQAFLTHSPLLLAETDHAFYHRFMRELARTAFELEAAARRGRTGLAQLSAAISFALYTLCAETADNDWKRASKLLAQALIGNILADGTPISRNPHDAVMLAARLLPLRTAYTARGRTAPPQLQTALDRLFRFLRLMRHSSGELALFNGMGATEFDLIGAILQFDDARGGPPAVSAPFGGYHRLERGDMAVLVDTGAAPPRHAAYAAHAGLASFEVSANGERIIVNCGAPPAGLADFREAVRETSAHSALVFSGQSTARFKSVTADDGLTQRTLLDPRDRPRFERLADGPEDILVIANEGALASRGLLHERSLTLAADGTVLRGEDMIQTDAKRSRSGLGVIELRFHLHPRVMPTADVEAGIVRLRAGDGSRWEFEAGGLPIAIEESIFFGGLASQRRTYQLVVQFPAADVTVIWSLRREGDGR